MKKLLFIAALLAAVPAFGQTVTNTYAGQARGNNNPGGCPDRRNINFTIFDTARIKYANDQGNFGFGDLKLDGTFTIITAADNPTRRFEMTGLVGTDRKTISGKFYFSNEYGRCHYTFDFKAK